MPTDDVHGFRGRLKRQREILATTDEITDADRAAITRFLRRKDGTVAISSLFGYVNRLRLTAERFDTPLVEFDRDDLEEVIFEYRHNTDYGSGDTPMSDNTIAGYEDALVMFFRDTLGHAWADDIERTPPDRSSVNPDDLLRQEEITALTSAATYQRDVALIEFFADTGARVAMTCSLRVRDVDLAGERPTYTPNDNALGLKGADITNYPIIDSAAALRLYLRNTHPRPDDPDAALFHKLGQFDGEDGSINPTYLARRLQEIADTAGVDTPANPHNFRHSAVTRMAREGFTRSQIEHRVHWDVDTDMWEIYEHIAAHEHNDDIFSAVGFGETDDSGPSKERHPCGNCGETLAPHHQFCPRCAAPATPETRAKFTDALSKLSSGQAEVDDPDRRELRAAIMQGLLSDARALGDHESSSTLDPNTD